MNLSNMLLLSYYENNYSPEEKVGIFSLQKICEKIKSIALEMHKNSITEASFYITPMNEFGELLKLPIGSFLTLSKALDAIQDSDDSLFEVVHKLTK